MSACSVFGRSGFGWREESAPDRIVSTTLYNDQLSGPLLRFRERQRVVVDIHNDTDTPEFVHWHGQMIPSDVDGAVEEGSPFAPAHGMRRISFTPKPSGFRFYHTHVAAGPTVFCCHQQLHMDFGSMALFNYA